MKHFFAFIFFLFFASVSVWATHNRAGEINLEQISTLKLRATITVYTKASSPVDRQELVINWGDGSSDTLPRSNGGSRGELLPNDIRKNIYIGTHTFPGRGTYQIGMIDPQRNGGILNVNYPNSDGVPFYIQTTYTFLNVNFQGFNSTPLLLQPPIDKGCVGKIFVHSINAYDPDGDSVAYRLAIPLQTQATVVPQYFFPDQINPGANNKISLNEVTGEFRWTTPQKEGEYNISFQVISYRGGIAIDTTIRDMQVVINKCEDIPPKVTTIEKICVVAGDRIVIPIRATDPDSGQKINLTALGGPFKVTKSPAIFQGKPFITQPAVDTFFWQTTCEHIQQYPYTVVFKSSDNYISDSTGLVDLKTLQIKVCGPPPLDVRAVANNNRTIVSWAKPYTCENADNKYFYAFAVWRRENSNQFIPDTCTPSMDNKGYTRLIFDTAFAVSNARYNYFDTNIERGKTYCYRITAYFAKRTLGGNPFNLVESLPSNEACVQLQRDLPLMLKASVTQTNTATGSVDVKWSKPIVADLDTLKHPGPYKFILQRSIGIGTTTFQDIYSVSSAYFATLNDTSFSDVKLNTQANAYTYRVGFYYKTDSLLGYASSASTHFLSIASSDRVNNLSWQKQVPWTNYSYTIFRQNATTNNFDSIGATKATTFADTSVRNKINYCYFVRASGSYGITGVPTPLINDSQIACGTPIDTVAPCPTVLTACNQCDSICALKTDNNSLINWRNPASLCGTRDVSHYTLYFSTTRSGVFNVLTTTNSPLDTQYIHIRTDGNAAGCYYVTTTDSVGNQSKPSNIVCIDNCPAYTLPNAFTPNDDKQNDVFKATAIKFISSVNIKIFNRWGDVVFESTDPKFTWDGKNKNGTDVAEGTYFYTCQVIENRVNGPTPSATPLSGYIELRRK